jgi:hypothetical protein
VFDRLSIGATKGNELINSGELKTYTIGRFRYATEEAVQEFIRAREKAASEEQPDQRSRKVAKAVAARTKRPQAAAG